MIVLAGVAVNVDTLHIGPGPLFDREHDVDALCGGIAYRFFERILLGQPCLDQLDERLDIVVRHRTPKGAAREAAQDSLGVGIGILGAEVLPPLINNPISLSPLATVGSIAVAVAIGVIFGVYPATRAARMAPIDALRSE